MIRTLLALTLTTGSAAALELDLPVDCDMGDRCYIQSYVDRDPGPGYADFTCGSLSYDGHKGVDFRVSTLAELEKGVDVIAAAPGRVRAIRDGEPDTGAANFTKGKDCGNAVVITHPGGWETQYCHLAQGSVAVKAGEEVASGAVLGRMGLSGRTEFPHLHLSVRRNGEPVDPFGAQPMGQSCVAAETDTLWSVAARVQIAYQPGGVVDIGLSPRPPSLREVRAGTVQTASSTAAPALIHWARFFGLRPDDELRLLLIGPDGAVLFNNKTTIARNRAEEMRYVGKQAKGAWRRGVYRATAELLRGGEVIDQKLQEFLLN